MRKLTKEEKEAYNCIQTIAEFGGDNLLCSAHRNYLKILLHLIDTSYLT